MGLVLAYLAGLLTILNPCVLPLAPIVIAGARAQDVRGPVAVAAGLALAFGLIGGMLAAAGVELGETGLVRTLAGALMIVFGLVLLLPSLGHSFERLFSPLVGWSERISQRLPGAGLAGQAATGAVLAVAWTPCVGPTLGAALALAASGGSIASAMATMTIFALGTATSLLAAGYGLGLLARRGRQLAGRSAAIGRALLGLVFALTGVGIISGLDRAVEAGLVEAMPDWLVSFATML